VTPLPPLTSKEAVPLMVRPDQGLPLPELFDETSRALDIREQEREGSAR
jgi:hypothetical protein